MVVEVVVDKVMNVVMDVVKVIVGDVVMVMVVLGMISHFIFTGNLLRMRKNFKILICCCSNLNIQVSKDAQVEQCHC